MSAAIQRVPFHGQDMEVVPMPDGDVGAIVRRLAESVGLDPDAQIARLARTAQSGVKWACTSVVKVQVGGQSRDVVVLPRRSIPMWAATVDAGKARNDVRPLLVAYQDEAAETLGDRFLGPRVMPEPLPPANGRPLTARQAEILGYIKAYAKTFQGAPTFREIGAHFGIASTNAVHDHLVCMEKKGAIRLRQGGKSRGIILPPEPAPLPPPPPPAAEARAERLERLLEQAIGALASMATARAGRRKRSPAGQAPLPFVPAA